MPGNTSSSSNSSLWRVSSGSSSNAGGASYPAQQPQQRRQQQQGLVLTAECMRAWLSYQSSHPCLFHLYSLVPSCAPAAADSSRCTAGVCAHRVACSGASFVCPVCVCIPVYMSVSVALSREQCGAAHIDVRGQHTLRMDNGNFVAQISGPTSHSAQQHCHLAHVLHAAAFGSPPRHLPVSVSAIIVALRTGARTSLISSSSAYVWLSFQAGHTLINLTVHLFSTTAVLLLLFSTVQYTN